MFTKVHLHNFRTFDDMVFDLSKKKGVPKNFITVYGENGAGKSNLLSAFSLLSELMLTMDLRDIYEEILSREAILVDAELEKSLMQQIMAGMRDMQTLINDYRMVSCNEPVVAEYEFTIAGNAGKYCIELGENEILSEKLEFIITSRKGTYFECRPDHISINGAIFTDKDLLLDIKATAKRFWGKHSMLAIIEHELHDKSKSFAENNLSENFCDLLASFRGISCQLRVADREFKHLDTPFSIFSSPNRGRIHKSNEKELDLAEKTFSTFFSSINSDITNLKYEKEYNGDYITYQLVVVKMIAGKLREVSFERESTGNHQLLNIFCCLLSGCFYRTVILDEADSGVHDVLFYKLLQGIHGHIKGQVIMTTHNTTLMEAKFAKDSTYIIYEENGGYKRIRCISDYEKRTYANNNIRSRYLDGTYKGIPDVAEIDFDQLLNTLDEALNVAHTDLSTNDSE